MRASRATTDAPPLPIRGCMRPSVALRLMVIVLSILPFAAFAQDPSDAASAGYRMGYLMGYFCPMIGIVAIVIATIVLIVAHVRKRNDRDGRNDRDSRW